jgi:two-component sensor histidine kinase
LSQDALKLQLKEKDVLFSEIQHRVKNNLQVVCSMLSIQASKSGPDAAESLRQASSRVRSMAMIHERLTSSKNLSNIDLGLYVQDLAREICQSHGYAGKLITNINGKVISTNLQKAVPCGLILNEIITNSLKHAFKTDYPAEIELNVEQDGTTVVLKVGDNGIGLHSVPVLELDTVGMKLITILTKQLDGQLTLPPGRGTRYVLKFTP